MTTVRHCPSVVVHVTVSVSVTNVQAQLVRLHDCNLRPYAKTIQYNTIQYYFIEKAVRTQLNKN